MKMSKTIFVSVIVLLAVTIVAIAVVFNTMKPIVNMISEKDLEEYTGRYLNEYKILFETYGPDLGNLSEFDFYLGYPYRVEGVVSKVHGAAIFFYSSSEEEIDVETIEERIEFYLWPEMKGWWDNSDTFMVLQEHETVTFDASVWPEPIKINPGGHFEIYGTLIYENRMILKGSNQKEKWLPEIALIEATNQFLWIAREKALDEAEIRKIEGYSLLRAKAEEIERKMETGEYGDNWRMKLKDEDEFWQIAEEWDIKAQAARQIREDVLGPYLEQPAFDPFQEWGMPIILGLIAAAIYGIIEWRFKLLRKRLQRLYRRGRTEKKVKRAKKRRKSGRK